MANTYLLLGENGEAINQIVADQSFVDTHYPDRYRLIGPAPEPTPVTLTPLQLRRLFTFEEKVACEQAVTNGNLYVKVLLDDLASAEFVDLNDPLVIQGLEMLVAQEILTQERADQIKANEMSETES